MLNFGLGELITIAVVALIFVGPERLPEMLRYMGRMYGKVRAATYDIRREFTLEVDKVVAEERTKMLKERREEMRRRYEEERAKKLAEQGQSSEDSPLAPDEYVPFDADPATATLNSNDAPSKITTKSEP